MPSASTDKQRFRVQRLLFVSQLERMTDAEIHALLRVESTDELCALNEFASRRLRDIIQREIRNTDG